MTCEEIRRKRLAYVLISAVGLLVLGLVYAWSIFATPIAVAYGWSGGELQTTFNIAMICFCVMALVGSFINKVLSTKVSMIIAALLLALGFAGTAVFAETSLIGIYVSYGVLCGSGCGMGYNLIIGTTNSWFPDKVGFSSGVMMMGMGLGSLILGTAANMLIEAVGIRLSFITLAIVAFVVMLLLAVLLKPAPVYVASMLLPHREGETGAAREPANDNPLKDIKFYVYMVWAILTIAVGLTLIGGVKQGALTLGAEASLATLLVGLVSTMNGAGRLLAGAIFDKAGLKAAIFSSGIVTTLAAIVIMCSYSVGVVTPYLVAAIAIGYGYGSIPVIASGFAREHFGSKNYARNFATINMAAAIGSFVSIGYVAFVSSDGASTNVEVWTASSVLAAIGLVAAVAFALMYKSRSEA